MKRNKFKRALHHLNKKHVVESAPTNNTTGVFSVTPSGVGPVGWTDRTFTTDISGNPLPKVSVADFTVGENPENATEARDTSGLFEDDGTIKTLTPPGDNSYILGPFSSMWYAWGNFTTLGYIRQSDRRMVNLGTITGKLSDWDGSSINSYGQLTLEQALWFKDVKKFGDIDNDPANHNYRAFYPGPPSNVADANGRYLCVIAASREEGGSETRPGAPDNPTEKGEMSPDDNHALKTHMDNKPNRDDYPNTRSGRKKYKEDLEKWKKEKERIEKDIEDKRNREKEERYEEAPWRRDEEKRAIEHGLSEKRAGEMSQDELDRFLDQQDKLQADIDKHSADQKKYEDEANKIIRDFGIDVALTILGPGLLKLGLKGLSLSARAAIKAAKAAKAASAKRKLDAATKALAAKKKLDKARAAEEARKLLAKTEKARKAAEAAKKAEKVAKANKKVNNIGDKLREKAKEKFDDIKRYVDKGKYDQLPDEDTASFVKLLKNDIDQMGKFIKKSSRKKPFDQLTKADFEGGPIPTNIDQLIQFMQGKGGLTWSFSRGTGTGPTPLFRQTPRLIKQIFKPSTKTKIRFTKTPKVDVKYRSSKPKYDLSKEVEKAIKKNKYTTPDEPTRLNPKKRFPVGEGKTFVLNESKKRLIREIRKPTDIPEENKKFKVKPRVLGHPSNKTLSNQMKDTTPNVAFKKEIPVWSMDQKIRNARSSQEKRNEVLEYLGSSGDHWNYMTKTIKEHNKKIIKLNYGGKEKKVTRKEQVDKDTLVFMEDELGNKSSMLQSKINEMQAEVGDKEMFAKYYEMHPQKKSLFKEVVKRGIFDYAKKPSKKGYPDKEPAKLDPNTGMHPEYGKKYKYDKLDPQSAESMPMQGNPDIDVNISKNVDQEKKNRKSRILSQPNG